MTPAERDARIRELAARTGRYRIAKRSPALRTFT